MAPLYSILSKEIIDQSWYFTIKINPDHEIYAGHFPELKIVPGAVLIQMV